MPSVTRYDTENKFNWNVITVEDVNDDGQLVNTFVLFDTGVWTLETTEFGIVTSYRTTDVEADGGLFNWTFKNAIYDSQTGELTQSGFDYDNGSMRVDFYQNGVLSSKLEGDSPDGDGVYNWYRRGSSFDENGVIIERGTEYDNGVNSTEFFVDGVRSRTMLTDDDDVMSWSEIQTNYNGQQVSKLTFYDDGVVRQDEWINGTRVEIRAFDNENAHNWTSSGTYFSEGEQVARVIEYDNGVLRLDEWENGSRSQTHQEDTHNVKNWYMIDTYYTDGVRVANVTTYDNGIVRTDEWEDGLRTVTHQDGTQGASLWSTTDTYYTDGVKVANITVYKTGIVRTEEFENGVRSVTTQEDVRDVKAWESIATYYDAETGDAVRREITNDDGVERLDLYEVDGSRRVTFEIDELNAHNWSEKTTGYYADGKVGARETLLDNGDKIVFAYQEDGEKDWRLDVDGDQSEDWLYRVTQYDVDGLNPVVTTYASDAELPWEYSPHYATYINGVIIQERDVLDV